MSHPDSSRQKPASRTDSHHFIRLRRRSFNEWLALLIWFIMLAVLFDYVLSSLHENETQAAVLAGALFAGLLLAGVTVQVMRGIEAMNPHRYWRDNYTENTADNDGTAVSLDTNDDLR